MASSTAGTNVGRATTVLRGTEDDRHILPGTFARLSVMVNELDLLEPEYGFILNCFKDMRRNEFMCEVVFLGPAYPVSQASDEPYVCSFPASFLAEVLSV